MESASCCFLSWWTAGAAVQHPQPCDTDQVSVGTSKCVVAPAPQHQHQPLVTSSRTRSLQAHAVAYMKVPEPCSSSSHVLDPHACARLAYMPMQGVPHAAPCHRGCVLLCTQLQKVYTKGRPGLWLRFRLRVLLCPGILLLAVWACAGWL